MRSIFTTIYIITFSGLLLYSCGAIRGAGDLGNNTGLLPNTPGDNGALLDDNSPGTQPTPVDPGNNDVAPPPISPTIVPPVPTTPPVPTVPPIPTTPPAPSTSPVVLYGFAGTTGFQGNLGSRAGVDQLCIDQKPDNVPQTNTRGFITVTMNDAIAKMPMNYNVPTDQPIESPNGTRIANNWSDLVDGSILTSLLDSGAVPAGSKTYQYWWSGSDGSGNIVGGGTCAGWSDGTYNQLGAVGEIQRTDSGWILNVKPQCNFTLIIMCIAFD